MENAREMQAPAMRLLERTFLEQDAQTSGSESVP